LSTPDMKLCWSPRSPFVRKVMMVAHERGLVERLVLIRTPVSMTELNEQVWRHNPLNKIPTLLLADGSALFDSPVICEYLDGLQGGIRMFPLDPRERIVALKRQALGDGLIDLLVLWNNELKRPVQYQSPPHLAGFSQRVQFALDALENDAQSLANAAFGIGHIAIGCALDYLDFRFAQLHWRDTRHSLADWHKSFSMRAAAVATAIDASGRE
jgi:glutathione S-transferase